MPEFLCIRFLPESFSAEIPLVDGWLLNAERKILREVTTLPLGEAVHRLAATSAQVLAILPGEAVLLTQVPIKRAQMHQLQQALPYLVEEVIADDISETHLATGALEGEKIPVTAIRKNVLERVLKMLGDAGVPANQIIADYFLPPADMDGWNIAVEAERLLVRSGTRSGFSGEIGLCLSILSAQQQRKITLFGLGAEQVAEKLQQAFPNAAIRAREAEVSLPARLSQLCAGEAINLLQGAYRPRHKRQFRAGRLLALAAIAWCVAQMVLSGTTLMILRQRTEEVQQHSIALYRKLYPHEQRILNPRAQMERHLRGNGGAEEGFLPLLGKIATAAGDDITQESLRYNGDKDEASIAIKAGSLDSLNRYKEALEKTGAAVTVQSAVTQTGGVSANLIVTGGTR